jgi:hypothetical protein
MSCLVLYSKPGCHLCEGLQEKLEQVIPLFSEPPHLEIRDITTQPEWWQAYEYEVPVLYWQSAPRASLVPIPRPSPRTTIAQLRQLLERYVYGK